MKRISGFGATNRSGANRQFGLCCAFSVIVLLAALAGPVAAADTAAETDQDETKVIHGAERSAPVTPVRFDGDLRDLPEPVAWKPGDPVKEIPMRHYPPPGAGPLAMDQAEVDPLVQYQQTMANESRLVDDEFSTPSRSFGAQGYTGVNPPDTVGDIGPEHFIQSVNAGGGALVRIWNKALPTPSQVASFVMDSLGSGFCANGYGDPIVLYDRQAERWMISEFASSGNHLCVYVSQTSNPVSGGWYFYDFTTPTFPDYPKYAVWATDANGGEGSYIVTANDGGPGVYALDRGKMLVGEAATFQKLSMPGLSGFGIQGPAPADPDGPDGPPAGSPAIVMRHHDTEVHVGPSAPGDLLEMWLFDVDWETPSNTTLTHAPNIDVSDFDSTVCGLSFAGCFPQPNSSTSLMPIREVIMNRLQYYRHADFESVVGNFVVDVGGNQGGVRWFELRRDPGGDWALQQEGTYSIDDDHRWMGSVAMDQSNNIALAYNIVSSTTYPSLRYTGRKADETPGVMTQPEGVIHAGAGSNSSYRYGDYAAMGLDPSDDCTFWFTGMDNNTSNWRTQVASFRFQLCGCELAPLPPLIDASVAGDNRIDLFWEDSELDTVIDYAIQRSRTPGGPYETIAVVADSSPGFAAGPGYSFEDGDVSGGITYYYVVTASDGELCRSRGDNEANATAIGICALRPIFAGLRDVTSSVYETCTTELSWDPALPECGGPATYNIYRSDAPGFAPGPQNLLVAGVTDTSARDVNALGDGVPYYYVVHAVDQSSKTEDTNQVELAVTSAGPGTGLNTVFFEDFEAADSFDDWTVLIGPNQHRCGDWERANSTTQRPQGGGGYYARSLSQACIELLPLTSTSVDSPAVDLNLPGILSVILQVNLYYHHKNGDDATVEVWDGSSWQVIWADSDTDVNERLTFDVTQYADGNPAFRVRFNYQNANDDYWFSVDDVTIIADILNPCFASSTPASAADGSGATTPLHADRQTTDGTSVQVSWDASCGASGYNLLYGDLTSVAAAAVDGSVCGIGGGGTFDWNGVPAGSLFFVIVGSDGDATESSWGQTSVGERRGLTASGQCGAAAKNISNICQ